MKRIWIAAAAVAALVTLSVPAMANDYQNNRNRHSGILNGVLSLYFGPSHVAPKYYHRHGRHQSAHHHPPGHYNHHKARRGHGQRHAAIQQHRRHGGARCYDRGHYTSCDETYNRGHGRGGHDGGGRRHSR